MRRSWLSTATWVPYGTAALLVRKWSGQVSIEVLTLSVWALLMGVIMMRLFVRKNREVTRLDLYSVTPEFLSVLLSAWLLMWAERAHHLNPFYFWTLFSATAFIYTVCDGIARTVPVRTQLIQR